MVHEELSIAMPPAIVSKRDPRVDVLRGLAQRSGERENICERNAGPLRGAGSASTPRLRARDVADSDQTRPPVARALERRGDLARR